MSSKGSANIYLFADNNEDNKRAFAAFSGENRGWHAYLPDPCDNSRIEMGMETDDAGYLPAMVGVACDAAHELRKSHGMGRDLVIEVAYDSYECTGDAGGHVELSFDGRGRLLYYRESVMTMRDAELPCEIAAALALL